MPTLPLYTPNPPHPNASHQVIAPGGYERWYFDAESASGDVVIVVVFSLGAPDHPDYAEYLKRDRLYRRRPTRHRPPVPAEYGAVSLSVHEHGRSLGRSIRPIPDQEFRASAGGLELSAGADTVVSAEGSIRVTAGGADLTFRPALPHAAREVVPPSLAILARHHHWVLAAPCCAVEGTLRVNGGRTLTFSGRGYHDYEYGTAPMTRRVRGRILGHASVVVFRSTLAERVGPGPNPRGANAHRIEADAGGVRESVVGLDFEAARHPARIEVDDNLTRLERPVALGESGSFDRLKYAISRSGEGMPADETALCEWY